MKSKLALVAVVLLLGWGTIAAAQSVSISLDNGSFKVTGWVPPSNTPSGGWASVFTVYAGTGDVPPLAGTYAVQAGALVFHPTYPFAPGVRYRAVFHPPGGAAAVEKFFDGPARETTPRARVERVYPSADVLPSNQLRLYIYFNSPMSRGESDARIHLLDENGKVLPGVFLPGEELWDPNNLRLTMTFDPGRIKRGLTSNEKMGPPIAEGKRYTLFIDGQWPDARGVPMVEGFRKVFRGGPSDRQPPEPKQWRLTPPRTGTSEALTVDFPDPMSYPLLERMIQVTSATGRVAGTIAIERQEQRWRFTPRKAWAAGDYKVVVDVAIEDLAGNHIGRAFDIDVFDKVTENLSSDSVSLPFTVR